MEPEKIILEWTLVDPIIESTPFLTGIELKKLNYWFCKELREDMGGNDGIHKPNDVGIFGNGPSLRSV